MASSGLLGRTEFLRMAARLAMPIMIQNLISTMVNSADTVMLGYVSQTAMSAAALANQFTFVLFCVYFGLSAGTSVLCAQYWGKGDGQTVERIIGLSAGITIAISLLFFTVSFFAPGVVMGIFTQSPETVEIGIRYLRILSVSFVFMGFSQIYFSALRAVGRVVFPSAAYLVSLVVNVVLNAAFIFGLCGLPRMGVAGVALGTVIARVTEAVMCLVYSARSRDVRFRVKYLFSDAGVLFGDFLKISLPSVANEAVWSMAVSVFSAILGHIGDDMVAANAVAVMVVNVGAIACRGFANATTIIVSQELGGSRLDAAKDYSARMLRLTLAVSLLGCGVILALRPVMLVFYADKLSATALSYLGMLMVMNTWRLVGEGINTCLICGCFRGGGDTRYGMIMDAIFMWGVAVPLMAAAAYWWKLPPLWVYFVMTLDEYEKMPFLFAHYLKYGWMKNITRDASEL